MFNPDSESHNEEPKIRYQKVEDLFLQEVQELDSGFGKAREVDVQTGESAEDRLKEDLKRENWWLNPYWQEKGSPKEQFEISFGDKKIDVYNFNPEGLGQSHLEELQKVIQLFSQIKNGSVFDKIKYILLDNQQENNPNFPGEDQNGAGAREDMAVKLYPAALKEIPHRIKPATNFEGTLMHEITHSLQDTDVQNEWAKKFGWQHVGSETRSSFKVKNPERCITDYARSINPSEDICESMVAAIVNPKSLDPERLKFLQQKFFDGIDVSGKPEITMQRHGEEEIKLPTIDPDIKFKKDVLDIKI